MKKLIEELDWDSVARTLIICLTVIAVVGMMISCCLKESAMSGKSLGERLEEANKKDK